MTSAALTLTSLRDLLADRASKESIRAFLDGLPPVDRVQMALSLRGKDVARLYHAVEGGRVTTVEDFVPASTPDGRTVIWQLRNSLPTFSLAGKRFTRLASGQVIGFNHQTWSFVTGPGYFVVKPASDAEVVQGEAFFDYTDTPASFPAGWPTFAPNTRGLSLAVYAHMKDYMRHVADNVFVGEAFRKDRPRGQFFVMAREG